MPKNYSYRHTRHGARTGGSLTSFEFAALITPSSRSILGDSDTWISDRPDLSREEPREELREEEPRGDGVPRERGLSESGGSSIPELSRESQGGLSQARATPRRPGIALVTLPTNSCHAEKRRPCPAASRTGGRLRLQLLLLAQCCCLVRFQVFVRLRNCFNITINFS